MSYIHVYTVRKLLGFQCIKNHKVDWKNAQKVCKEKLIEARRSGNDNLAAILSQVKETIKAKLRRIEYCDVCKAPLSRNRKHSGLRCPIHNPRLLSERARMAREKALAA